MGRSAVGAQETLCVPLVLGCSGPSATAAGTTRAEGPAGAPSPPRDPGSVDFAVQVLPVFGIWPQDTSLVLKH